MTVVVKIGGARAVDPDGALSDIAHLTVNDEPVVVVHGGSTAFDDTLDALGRDPEYVETPDGVVGRFTDEEAMDACEMAMGKLNTELTADLQEVGVNAVGLSGVDGRLLTGPRKSAVKVVEDGKKKIKRGDHSGKVADVNADLLTTLLDAGYTPVVGLPVLADDGTPVNADADRVAAAVAGALSASLVVLTDVPGLLEDPDDESTLIDHVTTKAEFDAAEDAADGFMRRKVMAISEALQAGAELATISDANIRDPITSALNGHGTCFAPDAVESEGSA